MSDIHELDFLSDGLGPSGMLRSLPTAEELDDVYDSGFRAAKGGLTATSCPFLTAFDARRVKSWMDGHLAGLLAE